MTIDSAETLDLVEPWIYSQLTDAALLTLLGGLDHISGTLSLDDLPLPYVHFSMNSTADVQGNSGLIISTDNVYLIKVVGATGSWDDLIPAASRIKQLFHRPGEVIDVDGGSLSCIRERIIQYPEITEGVQYRHLGAMWRIRASRDE